MSVENTKFILVGLGRCGSNLLKFALKQNKQIYMTGEYFNRNVHPESQEQEGKDRGQAFYAEVHAGAKAQGFKIFVHQARKEPANSVWDYLCNNRDIHVIHLTRKNTFKRILSHEVANMRGQWLHDTNGTDDIVISQSPEWWLDKLKLDDKKEKQLANRFQKHSVMHIYYEEIVSEWDDVTLKIQNFLGVEPVKVDKKTKKQEQIPPSKRCANYSDLVNAFQNTKYGWMFG